MSGVVSKELEVSMHINGWQRLWLLGSICWAVVILALAGIFPSGGDSVPSANTARLVVRLWVMPVAAIYALGLGIGWVRRGFRSGQSRPLPLR